MRKTVWKRIGGTMLVLGGCCAFSAADQPKRTEPAAPEATQYGVRMTPGIARAFAGLWLSDVLGEETKIPVAKQDRLAVSAALVLLRDARENGQALQSFLEQGLEAMAYQGQLKGERAAEFAAQSGAVVKTANKMIDALSDASKQILTASEQAELNEALNQARTLLSKFERRMARWSSGKIEEAESPFDVEYEPVGPESGPPPSQALRQAMATAKWSMTQLGTGSWSQLVRASGEFFDFDAEQTARADALLKTFGEKAAAVMTPQWREQVRKNRIESNLLIRITEPKEPRLYRLMRAYDELIVPLNEMEGELLEAVLGLARPEQRASGLAGARRLGREYGLTDDELRTLPSLEPR